VNQSKATRLSGRRYKTVSIAGSKLNAISQRLINLLVKSDIGVNEALLVLDHTATVISEKYNIDKIPNIMRIYDG
jgi:hypothetical protein